MLAPVSARASATGGKITKVEKDLIGLPAGAGAQGLGAARVRLSNELGAAVQAGVDIPLGSKGYGLTLDARKYWVKTTAHFTTATGVEALTTRHKIDAWILSAGVAYRF